MWLFCLIKVPAVINSRALNIAWADIWKNVNFGILIAIGRAISPSCLNVDKAIIFFISFSVMALIPAVRIVSILVTIIMSCIVFEFLTILLKRYIIKIPAVTRVDECTSAETGVGAAIAAGNQVE